NRPVQFDSCSKSYEERSPLDFADEAEASGRGTAAHEMSPPKDVPTTTAPRVTRLWKLLQQNLLRLETVVKEAMMGLMLMLPQSVPADVSNSDPLAFVDASSPHLADVAQ
nr:hypothetical protein [Tanacetum cinerariifolium]